MCNRRKKRKWRNQRLAAWLAKRRQRSQWRKWRRRIMAKQCGMVKRRWRWHAKIMAAAMKSMKCLIGEIYQAIINDGGEDRKAIAAMAAALSAVAKISGEKCSRRREMKRQ